MKAIAVFPGSHELKIIDQKIPRISQPDQVMLWMLAGYLAEWVTFTFSMKRSGTLTLLIAGRYPPQQAPDLILGRPTGIKSVIAFDVPRDSTQVAPYEIRIRGNA